MLSGPARPNGDNRPWKSSSKTVKKKRVIKGIGWTNKATHFWQIRLSVLLTDFGSIYTWKSVQHGFCAKNRLDKSLHIRFSSDCKES